MKDNILLNTQPLVGKLKDFLPLEIRLVNKTPLEPVWDYMVRKCHYLGYEKMIGPPVKYLVFYQDTPIAALSYNRAALRVGVRDAFLGWTEEQKRKLLPHVVNNNRFLILPWVRIQNLASHLLSRTLKMLLQDWPNLFSTEPYLVETFVDRDKYRGICYQAANRLYLGETKGFAKVGKTFVYHGNRKGVYIYLLNRQFRRLIEEDPCRHRTLKKVRERVPNMMLHTPDWNPELLAQADLNTEEVAKLGDLLDEYLAYFQGCYPRCDQRKHGESFVKGLLSDLNRKSIEPIALRYQDPKAVRTMQAFFQKSPWNDRMMLYLYQQRLASQVNEPDGMINVDGSDFPKKGKHSVGVHRQYCGMQGKTENCQAGVFVGYSGGKGYGLVDRRLYLPEKWFEEDHQKLREKCGVPEDVTFKTKVQLASEMIRNTLESGLFQARWIGCDSFFGNDKSFLDAIPQGYWYFADVKANTLVWLERPEWVMPEYKGRGRKPTKAVPSPAPVPVSAVANDDSLPWRTETLGEGAKGPIIAKVKCCRVAECRDKLPGNEIWLYIRRYENGNIKYSLCNAPADTPMETLNRAATLRWPIEQCFEECKSYLGMGHCEARSWNAWHRHMLFVFIAHLFTAEVRMRFKKTSHPDYVTSTSIDCSSVLQGSGFNREGIG